ncbi:MAG: histidine phosphatase family protein, partial [Burkholderiaceae bacterium]
MTPTRLLLIRHGETAWNAEHRIQGQLDIPLSPLGIRQSAQLAACLSGEEIDAVYSSELSRAWLTAAPVAQRLGLDV